MTIKTIEDKYNTLIKSIKIYEADFYEQLREYSENQVNEHEVVRSLLGYPDNHIHLQGYVNFETRQLFIHTKETNNTYTFDQLPPKYLAPIRSQLKTVNGPVKQLPLTDTGVVLLKELNASHPLDYEDTTASPSLSRLILERAFANEMVLLVQLEEYIKKNNLEDVVDAHSDLGTSMVTNKAFEASYNDGMKKMTRKVDELIQ